MSDTAPQFPLYIVSKGRADTRHTVKTLIAMKVPFRIVIEKQEYNDYSAVIDPKNILVLDPQYQRDYDTCDNFGMTKSVGAGAARNFVWDHSISEGYTWHWVMDDNIRDFYRYNKNERIRAYSPAIFRAMEDFCLRYQNIGMAGPNYSMFVSGHNTLGPYTRNTRIYSCNLIRNDVPFRWSGRYNEDTNLSLNMLKGMWCTVLFNAFLQGKLMTQVVKGGNTDDLYRNGTLEKSKSQVAMHADVSELTYRFGRFHHYVDYSQFSSMRLIRRQGVKIPTKKNEYGMKLSNVDRAKLYGQTD